jgi:hypothetical protein
MGSTCSSIRGKQKYSPGVKRSCTPNLDRRSHLSRGVGVSGTIKTSDRSGNLPMSRLETE